MGRNLTSLYISSSFQFLTQVSGSELQDGLGNKITGSLDITASKADQTYTQQTNANQNHYVAFVATTNDYETLETDNQLVYNPNTNLLTVTASLALNATSASFASTSVSSSYSTTALSASYAATATSSSVAINATSASYALTASYAANAGTTVSTASLLTTASAAGNVLTFTKGDASTFNVTVATGSIPSTSSLMVTGSVTNNVLTFTKGDGSTFSLTVATGSAVSASYADTASVALLNVLTASSTNDTITYTKGNGTTFTNVINNVSASISASFATNANTATSSSFSTTAASATSASIAATAVSASFASTIADGLNVTFGNITASNANFTNLTATSASFGYVRTVTGSAVVIGDEFIILNADTPAAPFAGIKVYDTGSAATASIEWNGNTDTWITVEENGASAMILTGLSGSKGAEVAPALNKILKGTGNNTVADSNITDDGSVVTIDSNTTITGSVIATTGFTGSLAGTASFADTAITASYVLNAVSSSFASTASFVTTAQTASFYDLSAVTQNAVFSGSVRGEVETLTVSSATASLDCSLGNFFTLTLVSGSNTYVNPTNIQPGQTINLRITQPSPGTGSISFPSSVKQVSGSAYVPTAATSSVDVVTFISFDSSNLYLSNIKNFV